MPGLKPALQRNYIHFCHFSDRNLKNKTYRVTYFYWGNKWCPKDRNPLEMRRGLVSWGATLRPFGCRWEEALPMLWAGWWLCSCVSMASSPHSYTCPRSKAFCVGSVLLMTVTQLPGSAEPGRTSSHLPAKICRQNLAVVSSWGSVSGSKLSVSFKTTRVTKLSLFLVENEPQRLNYILYPRVDWSGLADIEMNPETHLAQFD